MSKVIKLRFFDNFLTILREPCYANVRPLIAREQQKTLIPDRPGRTKMRGQKKNISSCLQIQPPTPLCLLCQIKAAPPPPGASMFSKSTENFSEDKWYRRTIFNAPELVDTTLKYPGPGAYDPVLNASSRSRRSPVHQLSSVPTLHPLALCLL